jgi:hypothetical protein
MSINIFNGILFWKIVYFAQYLITLADLTLIIIFSEFLKFWIIFFEIEKNEVKY